jgi:dUTP pyrophosphatase
MEECLIQFVKTHPDAKLPTKAHDEDNCYDVYACEDALISGCHSPVGLHCTVGSGMVPVGLKVGYISEGFGFVFRGRSGLSFKHGIVPHLGEIDNGYRGDLGVKMYNLTGETYHVKKGDRIAQIKVEKVWPSRVEFTEEHVESARGEGGFGSTGK